MKINRKEPNQSDANELLENLALRYVAGELNDTELTQFEEQLASDQQAREAVAEAVAVSQLAYAAFERDESLRRSPTVKHATSTSLRPSWGTAGVLAGAVAVLLLGSWLARDRSAPEEELVAESESVALVWAEVVGADNELLNPVVYHDDLDSELIDVQDASWMLAALSGIDEEDE